MTDRCYFQHHQTLIIRDNMLHELKIKPPYFEAVAADSKTFEIRYNDRGFQKSDGVRLREYDGGYTGREVLAIITYVSTYAQQNNYVVFSFRIFKKTLDILKRQEDA